jgi:hypothetical protein
MKKYLLPLALVALSTSSVFAAEFQLSDLALITSPGSSDPLPADQAKSIARAAGNAMIGVSFDCTASHKNYADKSFISNIVGIHGVQVFMAEKGSQPVLRFYHNFKTASRHEIEATVTTSADFKSIVSMTGVFFTTETRSINTGTIIDPKWEESQSRNVIGSATCVAK